MKNKSLILVGQLSSKYIGPKIRSDILENVNIFALIIWKTFHKCPAILPKFLLIFIAYACQLSVILFCHFLLYIFYLTSCSPHPLLYIGMFLLLRLFILSDLVCMHFGTFLIFLLNC